MVPRRQIPVTTDGIMPYGRYLIRQKGVVEVTFDACAMCHTRVLPGGDVVRGGKETFLSTTPKPTKTETQ
jgi:hypothetical protein